jgi:ubiquinone/menaquinone biosynthesis C-methylase UbiE
MPSVAADSPLCSQFDLAISGQFEEWVKLDSDPKQLRDLIAGIQAAYARGENVMAYAREAAGSLENTLDAILVAYDLQAGLDVAHAWTHPYETAEWCGQTARILSPLVTASDSVLEVGCGEATTLAGVLAQLAVAPRYALGIDLSWSRCAAGAGWLAEVGVPARLVVANMFDIPLADASIDVVYTSHALEPNGGREEAAIRELMRVARKAVVLVEPIYELATEAAQARMRSHGYVRGLRPTIERLGGTVAEYHLLPLTTNPLNPSGLIRIDVAAAGRKSGGTGDVPADGPAWRCPLTHTELQDLGDAFSSPETGVAYPVLRGIPLLRVEHSVVAAGLKGPAARLG